MAKYSYEFKKQLVSDYLSGKGSYRSLAGQHGISECLVKRWVANYRKFGETSLTRSRKKTVYSFEFKMNVVELYLTSELSYQDLAFQVGMTNPMTIAAWVSCYRTSGADALKPRKKGRKREMDKGKLIHEIENNGSDEQKELLKQLQEENLRLRIENAYLKESRRLRLEEEALLNEKLGSSTASEKNSN